MWFVAQNWHYFSNYCQISPQLSQFANIIIVWLGSKFSTSVVFIVHTTTRQAIVYRRLHSFPFQNSMLQMSQWSTLRTRLGFEFSTLVVFTGQIKHLAILDSKLHSSSKRHWYMADFIHLPGHWLLRQCHVPARTLSFQYPVFSLDTQHTHTHTTVLWSSWILSATTQVSRHQKGKTRKVKPIWIYCRKRSWVAVASAVHSLVLK